MSFAGVAWAFVLGTLLGAPPSGATPTTPSASSKKDHYLADKAAHAERKTRPTRVGRRAHKPIYARNLRTAELAILEGPGRLSDEGRHEFFRCWFTLEPSEIPAKLAGVIVSSAKHFDTREARIISGFRHPKYNLLLRKKGREVAKKSRHTKSEAIDFYFPEVAAKELYEHLLETHQGGVGFYPISEFVHVDLGPKRTWHGT